MRVAVMNTKASGRKRIVQTIQGYGSRGCSEPTEIKGYESYSQVTDAFRNMRSDGIFIAVEKIENFETAWRLHDMDRDCRIVFVSGGKKISAIRYRLEVAYYIRKLVEMERVMEALRRVAETKFL